MSRFIGRLVLEPDYDGRTAELHESFQYSSDFLGATLTVPKGFITDGASVPRIFWSLIPPWGRHGRAAIVHDLLYRRQELTRRQADDVLLEAMLASQCHYWQLVLIWGVVRCFGWHAWAKDAKKPLLEPNKDLIIKP